MTRGYRRECNSRGRGWGGARVEMEKKVRQMPGLFDRWALRLNPIIPLIVIERLEEHVFATTH